MSALASGSKLWFHLRMGVLTTRELSRHFSRGTFFLLVCNFYGAGNLSPLSGEHLRRRSPSREETSNYKYL